MYEEKNASDLVSLDVQVTIEIMQIRILPFFGIGSLFVLILCTYNIPTTYSNLGVLYHLTKDNFLDYANLWC